MTYDAPKVVGLPPNLPPGDSAEAWKALADAAAALHRIASAYAGTAGACLPLSLPTPSPLDPVTLLEVVNELLVAKSKRGRSDQYLRQLRHCFAEFSKGRSRKPVGSITTIEIEEWVDGLDVAGRTIKGRIQYLRTLFTFAQRRGYVASNPADAVDLPTITSDTTGVHTPAEVRAVMAAAQVVAPRVALVLALRYFAGLRAIEVARLGPEDIHRDQSRIVVPAHKAKTRQRRIIRIQPNLAAWLDLGAELPGVTCEQQICDVWKMAKVPWPRNVARHSFVSYHLAHFGSAAKTADQAGHSEAMLFGTYRELVTPEDAAAFWEIVP
jgi:integrase